MTGRIFRAGDDLPEDAYPAWLAGAVGEFIASVGDREYPCHFGWQAYLSGDLFGTWLSLGEDTAELGRNLAAFLKASTAVPEAPHGAGMLLRAGTPGPAARLVRGSILGPPVRLAGR